MIDGFNFDIARIQENLIQGPEVIVVGVTDEPGFHFIAQGGQESPQIGSLLGHSAIHHSHLSVVRQEHVGVADPIRLQGELPEGKV